MYCVVVVVVVVTVVVVVSLPSRQSRRKGLNTYGKNNATLLFLYGQLVITPRNVACQKIGERDGRQRMYENLRATPRSPCNGAVTIIPSLLLPLLFVRFTIEWHR